MPLKTQDVDFFLNQARIKLPGASDAGIKLELFSVIKEFLADSNSWIEHQQLNVVANTQSYVIAPRDGGQIIRLVGVWDGNCVLQPAAMPDFGTVVFQRRVAVTTDPTVTVRSSVHPWFVVLVKNIDLPQTREALPIAPQFVLQVYSGYILDGVLGKMMNEQAKSYTNVALAKYHLARFRDGIGIARDAAWNQNLFGGNRWVFPQTFATHSQRGGVSSGLWPGETF